MPQFAIHPADAGDETVGDDRAQHLAGIGVDPVDLAVAMLADPKRALRPSEAGGTAIARRRDGGDDFTRLAVDAADDGAGDLEQICAVERCAGIRRHLDRADNRAAGGIEGVDPIAAGEPDTRPVERKPVDGLHVWERPIFFEYVGSRTFHGRYSYHKRGVSPFVDARS